MIWKNYRLLTVFLLFSVSLGLSGCIKYSFTGTNIDPSIKSMTILNFENNSGEGPSYLTNLVSEQFRSYFQRNSNLKLLTKTGGDIEIQGQILAYNFSPSSLQNDPTQGDIAGANRLTIRLQVTYRNNKNPKDDFEQAFSSFKDFPQNVNISQIPERDLRDIVERMVQDVFNKSLANW